MHLLNAGTRRRILLQAGLSIKTERGLMLDRFRGRIMFPIHNHLGKVVGFTGRILPQFELGSARDRFCSAKYVNSPETPIFQKSKLLYGFWKSKDGVREAKISGAHGRPDGFSDELAVRREECHREFRYGAHRRSSARRSTASRKKLIVSFDNDIAGSDAAERAIDLAEANDFREGGGIQGFQRCRRCGEGRSGERQKVIAAACLRRNSILQKYLPKDAAC